jgi:hypothetical protein
LEINSTVLSEIIFQPELEVFYIMETFKKTIQENGPNSWSPFLVLFQDPFRKIAVCQSGDCPSKEDVLTSVSEIGNLISSLEAYSNILVLDFYLEEFEAYHNGKYYVCDNVLKFIFSSKSNICILNAPYVIDESSNDIIFLINEFTVEEGVELCNEDFSLIVSILHTYVHSNSSQFSPHHIFSYLTLAGHFPMIIDPNYKIQPFFNYGDPEEYNLSSSYISSNA